MLRAWCLGAVLAAVAGFVHAQSPEAVDPAFSIRGFGTVGYAQSSNGDAEFVRDLSQQTGVTNSGNSLVDSILGVQVNFHASESLELVAQAVSHQRYDGTFAPEVTWAFAKYDLNPRVLFRVGRIGTEFLLQSDSRMVGYSYTPLRPPVNFYGLLPINYGDGADVQVRYPVGDGVLRGSLYLGEAREQLPNYDVNGSPIRAASIGYDSGPFQIRLTHAEADLRNSQTKLAPLRATLTGLGATAAANALDMRGTLGAYDSVGVTYDTGSWQIQAGLNSVTHGTVLTENSKAGYFTVTRRFGNLSPYVGYSWSQSTAKFLDTGLTGMVGAMVNPQVDAVLKHSHQDQQTSTVGLRWDFARNFDLKVQFDFVHGDPTSTMLYSNARSGWDGRTTVFSFAVDFVF